MGVKILKIAVLVALLGGAFLGGMAYRERCPAPADEITDVLVVRADVPAGTVLNEELVETLRLPRRYMQQDAFEVRSMSDVKLVNDLAAAVMIPKGNQVTRSALVNPGLKPGPGAPVPAAQQHYLDGVKYFQNANYAKARAEWQAAVKLNPADAEARKGLKRIEQILAGGK